MGTAAELDRVTHGADANNIAVLFTEQSHCALVLCLLDWQLLDLNRVCRKNHLVDQMLYLCNLLGGHRREVAEVKAAAVLIIVGACLVNVVAQHLTQRQLKQMAGGVVGHDAAAALLVYLCRYGIFGGQAACGHGADVHKVTLVVLLGVFDGEDILSVDHHTGIADLTARLPIEGGRVHNQGRLLSFLHAVGKAAVADDGKDVCRLLQSGVTGELGRSHRCQVDAVGAPAADVLARFSCADPLLVHQTGKFFLVDGDVLLCQDFAGQINRETKGIVQTKGILAAEYAAFSVKGSHHLLKLLHTLVDGLLEALLFRLDDLHDVVLIFTQFRVCRFVFGNHRSGYLVQKFSFDAQQSAMTCRTAQQTS